MSDQAPPVPEGLRRVEVTTSERQLMELGRGFNAAFNALLTEGYPVDLVFTTLAFTLGVEARLHGVFLQVDEPVRAALPATKLGWDLALRVVGH